MERLTVPFEIKEMSEDEDFFFFEGLASTFGNIDLVDDIVLPGAFKDSLGKMTPKVLWQHDTWQPIGMPENIGEMEDGLFIKAKLPKADTFVSGRVMPQVKVGSISSMSIGFNVEDFEITDGVRILKKVKLFEVSLVTFPANPKAIVTNFKSDRKITIEDVEKLETREEYNTFLKDSGIYSRQAREFLAARFDPKQSKSDQGQSNSELTDAMTAFTKKLKEN